MSESARKAQGESRDGDPVSPETSKVSGASGMHPGVDARGLESAHPKNHSPQSASPTLAIIVTASPGNSLAETICLPRGGI